MSTPNPALVAAAPSLIALLQAVQQFEVDMGERNSQKGQVAEDDSADQAHIQPVDRMGPQIDHRS